MLAILLQILSITQFHQDCCKFMETIVSIKPLMAVMPIVASGGKPNLREGWTFLAGIIKFGLIVSMLPLVLDGTIIEYTLLEPLPGLAIQFRVDPMGMLFALV